MTGSNTAEKMSEKENTQHKLWPKKKSATLRHNPSSSFPFLEYNQFTDSGNYIIN